MPVPEFTIRTRGDWDAFAKRMKGADKPIRAELNKGIRAGTKPIVDAQKQAVMAWDGGGSGRGGGGRQGRAFTHIARSRNKAKAVHSARRRLAKGGFGLRATVASSIQTKITYGGARTGVRIRVDPARLGATGRKLPGYMDDGRWRHPVYGHRVWVTQTGPKGWFTDTAQRLAPGVRVEIEAAIRRALAQL